MHRETVTPKGKGLTLSSILKGLQPFDPDVAEVMYQCALCQVCHEWCVGNWDITDPILEARRKIVSLGIEPAQVRRIRTNIIEEGTPYGGKRDERFASIGPISVKKGASTLYFAGCGTAYRRPEVARAAIAVLKVAGIKYTLLSDEECCGAYLDIMGYREDARALAQKNVDRFKNSGCSVLVMGCPHCFYTIKEMYPQWDIKLPEGIRIVHMTTYLRELVMQDRIKLGPLHKTATYQDPCRLGRYCGIYKDPREVLVSIDGLNLVEMKWNREKANCCGYGSGLALTFPKLADDIAKDRFAQAKKTKAEILVTACQSCKSAFLNQCSKEDNLKIIDLIELVAENIS
jgi:Fe-S oxidoreductase